MTTDNELLHRYTEEGDESAFTEVVRRHTNLVYSAALRVTNSPPLAEEAVQVAFTKLFQQARRLRHYQSVVGWLHTTTRHAAIDLLRSEARRSAREQEGLAMHTESVRDDVNWAQLRPLLDEAVGRLNAPEREAVLLRYFNGLSHGEVGAALGLSENTANKRIERALEKLRTHFGRRGILATSAALAEAISMNSVVAAPAGLADQAAQGALASPVVAGGLGASLLTAFLFMSTKSKTLLAVATLAVVVTLAITLSNLFQASAAPAPTPQVAAAPAAPAPKATMTASATLPSVPATPPATPAVAPKPAAPAPATGVRQELNSTMDEIIAMLEAGDAVKTAETFLSPESFEIMGPGTKDMLLKQMQALLASPRGQDLLQKVIRVVKNMKTQEPTLNAAGDRASYHLADPTDPSFKVPVDLTFRKMEGKWYVIMAKSPE